MDHKFWNRNKCSFHKMILYSVSAIGILVLGLREQEAFTFSFEGLLLCCSSVENASWFWTVWFKASAHEQNGCTLCWRSFICVLKLMYPASRQAAHFGPMATVISVLLHLGEAFPWWNLSLVGYYLLSMKAVIKIWRLSTVLTILDSRSRHLCWWNTAFLPQEHLIWQSSMPVEVGTMACKQCSVPL